MAGIITTTFVRVIDGTEINQLGTITTSFNIGQRGVAGRSVVSIIKTDTQELTDTYTITYSDNTTSTFDVVNGIDGKTAYQSAVDGGYTGTEADFNADLALVSTKQDALGFTPENIANKGQNNGYAGLDAGGKVPIANLPSTLLVYKGVWDASTNTPELTTPDTDKKGWVYNVSVAGTQFGIDFKLGDWAIFNGNGVIEKSDNSDDVVSVNGQQGVVVLDYEDVGASPAGHDHSGETIKPETIDFDLTPTTAPNVQGRMQYSPTERTMEFGVEGGTIDVNKELFDYYVDTENNLVEGNVVSVTGISGNRQAVTKTNHTSRASATACIGMVTHKNADNTVRVTKKGRVRKLNTGGMTEGLPVYANATGGFTQTEPTAPDYFIHIGIVEVAHAVNGVIDVDIRIVYDVEYLSNVDGAATTVASGDSFFLKVGNLWKTITESNFLTWFRGLSHTWTLIQDFAAGLKTDLITKRNGSGLYALQDGGTIWHTTKWFTPTGTFSSVGTAVTTTGGQLTSAMVGAKIGVGEDKRVITAFLTSNTCTVDSAFSQDYSGVVSGSWGVYRRSYYISNGSFFLSSDNGQVLEQSPNGSTVIGSGIYCSTGLAFNLSYILATFRKDYTLNWTNSYEFNGTRDTGLRRANPGLLEIFDGITAGTTRDLKLRSLYGDKIIPNLNTGLKIGTVYSTQLTTATNNTAITSIAVSDTTGFPATGTILIGGVTSVAYTSKTTTSFVFASTVIPTYAIGTEVLVTSAGSYLKIDADGFFNAQYDDILPSAEWTPASGGTAPDTATHTIGGMAANYKAFDGGTTEESMVSSFEILHAVDVDALNRATAPLLMEIHTHGMPATTGSGDVKIFYDLVYQPVNAAPIAWGTYSNIITIGANQQYYHKLGGVELTKPSSGYQIGDQIIVKYRRTPSDAQDTYAGDWLFMQCALHAPMNSNGSRTRYTK